MDRQKLAVLVAALAAVGLITFWPKQSFAAEGESPEPPPLPPNPEPPPPLPPAPPSQGEPTRVDYWAQKPPPGRETVGPTDPIPSGSLYTLKAGESWSNLSERTYGDYRWWPYLWDMNRKEYPNYQRVKVGSVITLPVRSGLPMEKKDAYFARAEAERQVWINHKRSGKFGKTTPVMPASVTDPTP